MRPMWSVGKLTEREETTLRLWSRRWSVLIASVVVPPVKALGSGAVACEFISSELLVRSPVTGVSEAVKASSELALWRLSRCGEAVGLFSPSKASLELYDLTALRVVAPGP
jgi:hypothetical protein